MNKKTWEEQLRNAASMLGLMTDKEQPSRDEAVLEEELDFASPLRAGRERQRHILDTGHSVSPPTQRLAPQWRARVRHRQFLEQLGIEYQGSTVLPASVRRTDVCYNCRSRVDSGIHALCARCEIRNIICPSCGACGCGYADGGSSLTDEAFLDNVERWIVTEGGRVVFPATVSGESWSDILAASVNRRNTYSEYLQSQTRRERRNGALKSAHHRCERCSSASSLHVHHKTYARVGGWELAADLEVLCAQCHYREHEQFAERYVGYLRKGTTAA